MRCQFCGWDNPQGKETCEKCNKPLTSNVEANFTAAPVSVSNGTNFSRPTERQAAGTFDLKSTVREMPDVSKANNAEKTACPECGYPLENGECSSCGYKTVDSESTQGNFAIDPKKTVRPIRKVENDVCFKLIPISEKTGMPEGEELSYEGNTVVLNRDNTDPKNSTITSQEQASLSYENGKWSIEDKSEYKTTFVQAARKIELQQGDLILLGDQLYRFE